MPTYSYKGYDFDVDHEPTEEEFTQMSAYVDTLPPKSSLADKIPQPLKNAYGGIEAVGTMIANTPDWLYNFGSRLPGKLTGVDVGEGEHLYQVHPKTDAGKVAEEALGKGFEFALKGAGKAATVQDQLIRKATDKLVGTDLAYKTPEDFQKAVEDHTFGAEGLMVASATKALPKQVGSLFKTFKSKAEIKKSTIDADFEAEAAKEQVKSPPIQDPSLPVIKDAPPLVPDSWKAGMEAPAENRPLPVIPDQLKPLSEQYPQGIDIGAVEGGVFPNNRPLPQLPPQEKGLLSLVEKENSPVGKQDYPANAEPFPDTPNIPPLGEHPREITKQAEIEQAWEQKKAQDQAESSALKDDAFTRAEAEQAPLTLEPEQGTSGLFGFGKPSSLGGVGKKQGGAIGFKPEKPPTLDQFRKDHNPEGKYSEELVKKMYEKYYGSVKEGEPQAKAFSKATGLPEVTSLKPVEEMIPRWDVEEDLSSNGITKALRENLSSGGRMTAARTGNSFVDWSVEHVLGNLRETQVNVKKLQNDLKGEVKKVTGNLLEKFGGSEADFIKTMGELLRVKGTEEVPNIPKSTEILATKLRQHLDTTGKLVQDTLAELGYKNFHWRNNYLSGVFNGPYRSVATMVDANGTTHYLGVVAGKTKAEAQAGIEWVRQSMPEATITDAKYNAKFDNAGTELGKRYGAINEVLNVIRNDDPLAARFQDLMESYYSKKMSDYFGYKQHMKSAKDIVGSEGNVPWRTAKDNAYDLFEAQLATMDQALHWVAKVKTEKVIRPLLNQYQAKMPQATEYVKMYYEHAYGELQNNMAIVDNAIAWAAETTGISPSQVREVSSIMRNFALTNTLGASTGFLLTQVTQVPQALAVSFARALERGIQANPRMASSAGMLDMYNYLRGNKADLSVEGRHFVDYASKYGIFDAHLVEHTIHRKVIPTTGMGTLGRAATFPVNTILKGMDLESQMMGKAFIEYPESATRGAFFMSMAHYYKQAGYSTKEAAHLADKDTSIHFVDYSPQERAMGFQKLGELGKYMSTVSTFKINSLNQIPTYTNRKMYGTLAALGLASWAASGLLGFPGIDQLDWATNQLKQEGLVNSTAKQYMLENWHDTANFGALGQTPKLWDGPAMAIQTKFAQNDILPNSIGEFLYPLYRFYTKRGEKIVDYVKNPLPETRDAAIRENIPGNSKFIFEHFSSLTDKNGMTRDPNNLLTGMSFKRDKSTNKHEFALAVPTLDEYKVKYGNFMNKQDAQATKETLAKVLEKGTLAAFNGDKEAFKEAFKRYLEIDPVSASKAFTAKINEAKKARNIPAEEYFKIMLAEKAKTKPGIERFRRYKGMLDGSATTSK